MKIKSFENYINENYNEVNENWFKQVYGWVKDKFTTWSSKLKGKVKEGADYGLEYLEKNPKEFENIKKGLAKQSKADIEELYKKVQAFNPDKVHESMEPKDALDKIANIIGVSVTIIASFGGAIAALIGLISSNGFLFFIGAVVSIITFSAINAISDN
jgi:hypothetical protein